MGRLAKSLVWVQVVPVAVDGRVSVCGRGGGDTTGGQARLEREGKGYQVAFLGWLAPPMIQKTRRPINLLSPPPSFPPSKQSAA